MSIQDAPIFIRPKAGAKRWSVSLTTINRALAKGELTRHKRGRCTLIRVAEGDAWACGEVPSTTREE